MLILSDEKEFCEPERLCGDQLLSIFPFVPLDYKLNNLLQNQGDAFLKAVAIPV